MSIGASNSGQTSVTPQRGDWDSMPGSLMVRNLASHIALCREDAPRMLRPRVLADTMRVVAVSRVGSSVYLASEQRLIAEVFDANGASLTLSRSHQSHTPHALDAMADAMCGPLRFVSGELRASASGLEMEPVALVTDRMIVPDLAPEAIAWQYPHVTHAATPDALADALRAAGDALEEGVHSGTRTPRSDWRTRLASAATALEACGANGFSLRVRRLAESQQGAVEHAWFDASIRLTLALDAR